MTSTRRTSIVIASALVLLVLLTAAVPALAQSKPAKNPGSYHGEFDFPISWKRYYAYSEWTAIMADLQKKYAALANIQSIGKSRMGRDQWLLTITNKAAGKAEAKPAMWVDGAIHGNEVNGITCSLYIAWYLLTRYDYDPFVHNLVDTTTFYILPGFNVDGNDSYVRFPNTENNPREPYRPADDDGDGLYDEDQTEDVDGDGELSIMWIEDPAGDFKLSPDRRRFVPVSDPREPGQRFRRVGGEGFDNDGDGRINEDDIGGPDPNRNFSFGWGLASGWPYPHSEVETRNVFEFQQAHPNIFAAFNFHNTGRLIMFQAPLAVPPPPGETPEARQRAVEQFNQRLAELQKANKYAYLLDRRVAPEYQNDLNVQQDIVTAGARILKDYRPTPGGLSGQAAAASYHMLGAYSYLIELWGSQPGEADDNSDGRVDDEEFLQWLDLELMGEGWMEPHPFTHPDLGLIWIGGSAKKHIGRTPPARYIETEALRNANFVLYCASQFPKVEVTDIRVRPATGDLFWVDATVTNDRAYPTSSDRSVALGRAVMDRVSVKASEGVAVLEVPQAPTVVDPLNPALTVDVVTGVPLEFRLGARSTKRFSTLVRMTGREGWVEFTVTSKAGGTATKRIAITR